MWRAMSYYPKREGTSSNFCFFFFLSLPIGQALHGTPDAHSTNRGHTFQEAGRGIAVVLQSCGAPVHHLVGV